MISPKARAALEVVAVVAVIMGVRAWQRRDVISGHAPALSAQTIEGRAVSLGSDKPTLVHFWASWCGVCDAMDGQVARVAKEHRVITVATGSGNADAIRRKMHEEGLENAFEVIADPTGEISRAWGVTTLPTSFVVDRSGMLRATEVGFTTALGLRARLMLAE